MPVTVMLDPPPTGTATRVKLVMAAQSSREAQLQAAGRHKSKQ